MKEEPYIDAPIRESFPALTMIGDTGFSTILLAGEDPMKVLVPTNTKEPPAADESKRLSIRHADERPPQRAYASSMFSVKLD